MVALIAALVLGMLTPDVPKPHRAGVVRVRHSDSHAGPLVLVHGSIMTHQGGNV